MQGQIDQIDFDQLSWFEDIREASKKQVLLDEVNFNAQGQNSALNMNALNIDYKKINQSFQQPQNTFKDEAQTKIEEQDQSSSQQKPSRRQNNSIQDYRAPKEQKQQIYSKTYRQRKKEQYKILQEENTFLKTRIKELQYQLRQREIELNRFKFPPPEKQLSVEQIQREFLEVNVTKVKQHKSGPMKQDKIVYTPADSFYYEFLDSYNKRGFGGSLKKKLIDYHFNEILEGIMKDSQRYLSLLFYKNKSWENLEPLPEYEPINTAFYEVFQIDEDLKQRLKYFTKNLHALNLEFTQQCSSFYRSFYKIQESCQKIHSFLRQTYLSNMDVARKRIELQPWFEYHKYGKMMRNLRFQWLDIIKGTQVEDEGNSKKTKKQAKKNKTHKTKQ